MMEEARCWLVGMMVACLSFFRPIGDFMSAMVLLFFADFVFGVISALLQGEQWSGGKAKNFLFCCFLFFSLSAGVFVVGHLMHNEGGAVQCMSYICYATIYIYGTNILRNVIGIVPKESEFGMLLQFIYYVVTLEVVKKIPFLEKWREKTVEEGE